MNLPGITTAIDVTAGHQASPHIPELDGLRGIAVLMVVFYHAFFWSMGGKSGWPFFPGMVASVTQFGWLGVDLFFVLSGFLITGVLLRAKGKPRFLKLFYIRRALRILPVYYGFLLVLELLSPSRNSSFVLVSLVYLSNAAPLLGVPMIYGPLWSLSVEEHFYLLWPWLVSAASASALTVISAGVIAVEPFVRLWGFQVGADTFGLSWFRFDGLAFGAIIALFVRSTRYSPRRLLVIAGISSFTAIVLIGAWTPMGILTRTRPLGAALQSTCSGLVFCACVAAVVACAGGKGTAFLRWNILRYCGDISYCWYVIHLMVFFSWDDLMKRAIPSWTGNRFEIICLRAVCCIGISFGIAVLSRKYWELPFLRLKERFE